MKNAKVTIFPADIVKVTYVNTFKAKPGEPLKISFRNGIDVKMNVNAPTQAVAKYACLVKAENDEIVCNLEMLVRVSASTYIDDFESVIKKDFAGAIINSCLEKVKTFLQFAGITFPIGPVAYPYGEQDDNSGDSLDNILNSIGKK